MVTKDDLIGAIWGGRIVSESALTTRINAARTGIGDSGEAQRLIKTLPRKGVRFIGTVREAAREVENAVVPLKTEISTLVVGRTPSFETIDQMTRHVLSGKRQMAFVTGEAGIGKTAFIAKALEQLTEQGFDQLYGRCTERFGTDEVFLPLIDALVSRYRANGPELISAVRAHAPTWILQLPGVIDASERAAFQDEVFGATRERMLREFCDLLEALSARPPLGSCSRRSALERLRDTRRTVSLRARERQRARAGPLLLSSGRQFRRRASHPSPAPGPRDSRILQRIAPRSVVASGGRALPGIALRRRAACLQPVKAGIRANAGTSLCLLPRCSST